MELEDESKRLVKSIDEMKPTINKHLMKDDDEDSGISGESGSSTDSEIAQWERILERLRLLTRELEQTLSPESKIQIQIQNQYQYIDQLERRIEFNGNRSSKHVGVRFPHRSGQLLRILQYVRCISWEFPVSFESKSAVRLSQRLH